MPEEILKKIKNNVPPQWKTCFISAVTVGFIAHLYKMTGWLPNWDSLVFRYDTQNMIALGRWFLPIVCSPSSFYDLPWLVGLLAILLHGLGAVCICKTLNVQKKVTAALIGALIVSFPTVTSVLTYNYVADGYSFAFLLSCLAAMLITDKKPRYIASTVCIALSAGIYQAYVTVTVMLLLCHLILEVLREDSKVKDITVKTLKLLLTGACGMLLYYIVLIVILKITGTELLEYQGFDSAVSFSGINIPGALYNIKHTFMDYFFDLSGGISVWFVLNCAIFFLTVLLYLGEIIKTKPSIAKLLLLALYCILLPIGAVLLAFINSDIDYHNLMKMGFCVFYIFFLLHYERSEYKLLKLNSAKAWTILAVAFLLIFNNATIANVSYHKLEIAYEKSYGVLIRIVDRIEQTEGAQDCDRILVLGALEGSEAYSANLPPDITGTTDGYILRADDEMVGQSVLCSALNDYCGKSYSFLFNEYEARKSPINERLKHPLSSIRRLTSSGFDIGYPSTKLRCSVKRASLHANFCTNPSTSPFGKTLTLLRMPFFRHASMHSL